MSLNQNFAGAGRNAEQEKYYARLFAGISARARRALPGRQADALDMAQEAMERFLVQFPRGVIPPEAVARAWLGRTFDRMVINEWRKLEVRRRALSDPGLHLRLVSGPDEADVGGEHQDPSELQDAVSQLSPKLREAFVLHQGGLSRRRIALELHINENAVSKRLHDARARLRELVGSPAPHRGAHFAVRSRPRHDGPGPAAARS